MDEDRVGVVGFSGGGALACRLGMEKPIWVQAVASYFAPSDLALLHKNAGLAALFIRPQLDQWLGGPPDKVPQKYAEASPLSCVCKEAAPILLLHGSRDGVVPLEHSQLLCRELRKVGANVTFLTFDNAPHDFDERRDTSARLAAAAVEVFLMEHLQRRTAAPRPPP